MDLNITLSLVFFVLLILFFILTKKNSAFAPLKTVIPYLLSISLISFILYLLDQPLITDYFQSKELHFFLGLLLFSLILVVAIKVIVFSVFDFFLLHRLNFRYIKFFKDLIVIILYIIGILIIVNSYLNIKITAILATSAIFTVVAGFALQDILGDLFSGIALNFEDSLKIGDWIKIGDIEGRIEQLRWRAVKIRTIDNVLILVPNQIASKKEIYNFIGKKEGFALRIQIGVSYKNSPDFVISVIKDTLFNVNKVLKKPLPEVYVYSYDDFSIGYDIRFYIKNYGDKNIIESNIRRKIWYAFKRNNIKIPFPIRDVYIRKEEHSGISTGEVFKRLSNNPILSLIEKDQLETIIGEFEIDLYGENESVIEDGKQPEYFYYIFDGEVEILKNNHHINSLGRDDYFGEISMLTGTVATADVRVRSESTILKIPSSRFKEVVKMNEGLAKKMAEVIAIRKIRISELKSEKEADLQDGISKESKTLLKRIKKYFSI